MNGLGTDQNDTRARRARATAVLASLVALAAAPALAGDRDDAALAALIEDKLARQDLERVSVQVEDGVARLAGTVDSLRQKDRAGRIANVDGVAAVENDTRVIALRPTAEVARDVERALGDPRFHTIFDWIEAEVSGGSVLLTGWVTMPWKIDAATARMSRIEGVDSVEAKLEVLPVSIFDDQIRASAARRLYGDLAFVDRARSVNPPIHVVVRHGEVILMGEVRNRAEKMRARSLVSSSALALRIVDRLRWSGDGRS